MTRYAFLFNLPQYVPAEENNMEVHRNCIFEKLNFIKKKKFIPMQLIRKQRSDSVSANMHVQTKGEHKIPHIHANININALHLHLPAAAVWGSCSDTLLKSHCYYTPKSACD
jgi:hypothetical protein